MSCRFDATTKIQRAAEVFSAEIDAELVLMHVARSQYYGLDSVGMAIWQLLEHEIQLGNLYAALARQYDADIATIERDVRPWLEQLAGENLIELRT